MKQKITAYIAILIISIGLMAMPVFAATTTLTTSIPHNVNVEVDIEGNGIIAFGDVVCKASGVIEIPRNGNITITATPNNGWMLQSATIGEEDFTDRLQKGSITLETVAEDLTMKIQFQKIAKLPQTGDVGVAPWLFLVCISAMGLIVLCRKDKAPT